MSLASSPLAFGSSGEPRKLNTTQRPAATCRLKAPSPISGAPNHGTGSPKVMALLPLVFCDMTDPSVAIVPVLSCIFMVNDLLTPARQTFQDAARLGSAVAIAVSS